ncbi:diacylglycerol kinase [Lacticaseibacillus brantae]|nr:diacylglycerol kinase family protein [Lacticaseibacillus brantae]
MASNDKQTHKNRHFCQSLQHALAGLRVFFMEEGNFRREFVLSALVIVAGVAFQISWFDWFVIALSILLVFLSELWNTIIENVVDFIIGHQFDVRAKKIKDMSAGAVVLAGLVAILAGVYVFGPKLIDFLGGFLND